MIPLKCFQNLKVISINKDRNDITLNNIYIKSKLQKKNHQISIKDISSNIKDKIEKKNNHKIEKELDENIL